MTAGPVPLASTYTACSGCANSPGLSGFYAQTGCEISATYINAMAIKNGFSTGSPIWIMCYTPLVNWLVQSMGACSVSALIKTCQNIVFARFLAYSCLHSGHIFVLSAGYGYLQLFQASMEKYYVKSKYRVYGYHYCCLTDSYVSVVGLPCILPKLVYFYICQSGKCHW